MGDIEADMRNARIVMVDGHNLNLLDHVEMVIAPINRSNRNFLLRTPFSQHDGYPLSVRTHP
ncbi:MAG: hypothetical protein MI806_03040, partial [Minwuiales bacterium]|nr:hypothetical protein [Minwuiales bacterium]